MEAAQGRAPAQARRPGTTEQLEAAAQAVSLLERRAAAG
jgi:hypothetical protein